MYNYMKYLHLSRMKFYEQNLQPQLTEYKVNSRKFLSYLALC